MTTVLYRTAAIPTVMIGGDNAGIGELARNLRAEMEAASAAPAIATLRRTVKQEKSAPRLHRVGLRVPFGGNLEAFARMDGAWLSSVNIATIKRRAA